MVNLACEVPDSIAAAATSSRRTSRLAAEVADCTPAWLVKPICNSSVAMEVLGSPAATDDRIRLMAKRTDGVTLTTWAEDAMGRVTPRIGTEVPDTIAASV